MSVQQSLAAELVSGSVYKWSAPLLPVLTSEYISLYQLDYREGVLVLVRVAAREDLDEQDGETVHLTSDTEQVRLEGRGKEKTYMHKQRRIVENRRQIQLDVLEGMS